MARVKARVKRSEIRNIVVVENMGHRISVSQQGIRRCLRARVREHIVTHMMMQVVHLRVVVGIIP